MFPASDAAAKEAAVVERRRRMEEERKKRIFDAKNRTIGVDKTALEAQVAERKEREELEKQRDRAFDMQALAAEQHLIQMEADIQRERAEVARQVENYRAQFQQTTMRKEFDLNNPDALKLDVPARIGDDDPRLGPSSLQRFDGEDLSVTDRKKQQQQQQRDFIIQQAQEKLKRQQFDEETERLRQLREREVALRLRELELEAERARRVTAVQTKQFNLAQAEEARAAESRRRHEETLDSIEETRHWMEGSFLNEDMNRQVAATNPRRVVPYAYKGLFPEQHQAILEMQRKQQEELRVLSPPFVVPVPAASRRRFSAGLILTGPSFPSFGPSTVQQAREREATAEREYARQQAAISRTLTLQEREAERLRRDAAQRLAEEHRQQALQAKEKLEATNALYAGRVDESFFSQFGTSSR
ncbi:putative protofilament ribbon protein [Paratrimastix pyriformis]|uniref:Protofilament ribbon protein n=1 Tax=Paratrimastix pyriformis TaxID=342808 RepID=A0ABQ8UTJ2_9EUKA|nr:putative protofilament ribbon protein [Paratrimastix pyriformis]